MSVIEKPRILIFCDYYLPGFKSGGGMRTIVNTVERLGDKYDFRIICRNHDGKADKRPYRNVKLNDWNKIGKASVYYISNSHIKPEKIGKLIKSVSPKSIYSNSCFSTFTVLLLLMRRFGKLSGYPLIIAPEGELSVGALQLKKTKKTLYSAFAKTLNLYSDIIWKTTAEPEQREVEKFKGKGGKIFIAPNMPPKMILPEFNPKLKIYKEKGTLKAVFLSRIHPKKNLKYLLEVIQNIEDKLILDIYGPIEDEIYFNECLEIIKKSPKNPEINIKGEISHDQVAETFFKYHFFIMPTLGENFGHVFIESLAAGCPLIISDRTPWRDLEKNQIGFDIPLENTSEWIEKLKYCINLDEVNYRVLADSSRNYATEWLADPAVEEATEEVIKYSLSKTLAKFK